MCGCGRHPTLRCCSFWSNSNDSFSSLTVNNQEYMHITPMASMTDLADDPEDTAAATADIVCKKHPHAAHISPASHETDEFRMYAFKVKRCGKTRNHDWTECPYAHRGEKARRRDPRKYRYLGVACAEFRHAGGCSKGQRCEFAHGVFEFWLHPSRYRTRTCKAGADCDRRVCFFAHTPEQLRGPLRGTVAEGGGDLGYWECTDSSSYYDPYWESAEEETGLPIGEDLDPAALMVQGTVGSHGGVATAADMNALLAGFRGMKLSSSAAAAVVENQGLGLGGGDGVVDYSPDFDWICELIK